jgi:hypothetical protein
MKIIISERQYRILLGEQTQVLSSVLNGMKFISGLVSLVESISRGYNTASGQKIKDSLERVQSLTKQSLAGGRTDLTEGEMEIIRQYSKITLNKVANKFGYHNWTELKNEKIKKLNDSLKNNERIKKLKNLTYHNER